VARPRHPLVVRRSVVTDYRFVALKPSSVTTQTARARLAFDDNFAIEAILNA